MRGTGVRMEAAAVLDSRLLEWNNTVAEFPAHRCIHELIEERAAATAAAEAVRCPNSRLTYGELNARANRLARHLRTLGVGPDRRVAICLERSTEMVVGLLAILKAGAAYVPLDPGYPTGRLAQMLADSAPLAVLSHPPARSILALAKQAAQSRAPVLDLVSDAVLWSGLSGADISRRETGLTSRNLAYVIYTCGSTGVPKGVMNEHRSLVNRLCWMQHAYPIDASDTVLQKTPFSFDVSVWEFLWTLMAGARLVMARPEGHRDPLYLRRVIQQERVTTLHFVPSMLQLFLNAPDVGACRSLKRVFCSGEALPATVLKRFCAALPQTHIYNLYGPTEAAIDVTFWNCVAPVESTDQSPPIGRPIWNTRIYILDQSGEPVPVGAAGEIYIGGIGVARGYSNRPDLTAERFVSSPFVESDRLYKTGDLGRFLPDGNVEYLGRNDHQVKVNGLRIELGEIEARLLEFPGVSGAVVVVREPSPGDKRLVAYYTVISEADLGSDEIKAHLAQTLAPYMIPAAFMRLPHLPLTPNGKLDRSALPAPGTGAFDLRPVRQCN